MYKILTLIGCVIGLLVTTFFLLIAFGRSDLPEKQDYILYGSTVSTIIVYVLALTITFVTSRKKTAGISLIISALLVLFLSRSYDGIIGFALLLPAGILRLQKKVNKDAGVT
ncbi:MAG: hypothetical protein ACR2KF_03210 [Nitrososphaeraceae archaeon]